MNETIDNLQYKINNIKRTAWLAGMNPSIKLLAVCGCMAIIFQLGDSVKSVCAQEPAGVVQAYGEFPPGYNLQGNIQQVQLPGREQYYEYLPPKRGWDDPIESPLDRMIKQTFSQMYGRVDYLHWSFSDPGSKHIGAEGKKLRLGEGFSTPAIIDGPRLIIPALASPIRLPLLQEQGEGKVLIQTWESNQRELFDVDGDGNIFDVIDIIDNANPNANTPIADGINDDDNDLDIFPRLTNQAKTDFLSTFLNDPTQLPFSTGLPGAPSQVAVLAVGQLAYLDSLQLDNNNGFRGMFGIPLTFGAFETDFMVMNNATSSAEFVPLAGSLIGSPANFLGGNDPQVIPVTVNGAMAPNIFDDAGNLVTDSNNYYILFNESYTVNYTSEAWGFSSSMFWTLKERPERFKLESSLGFRYFDFREQMIQRGTFSNDPATADFVYTNEGNSPVSVIDSVTKNHVYGPTAGLRGQIGDEKFSVGIDTKVVFGINTNEAKVAVDDLLFVGDDNFTEDNGTQFAPGFEMIVDAKVKLTEHATLVFGYNLLSFGGVSRPANNIQYDVTAARVANPPPNGGPDYIVNNNFIINKKKTSIDLSGFSSGLLINW